MKLISILFCTIFFSNLSFSQYIYEDTNQSDSIYKINKISSKTLRHLNDRVSIKYDYNINGKLIAESHLLKDTQLISKKSMSYNSSDILIKEEAEVFIKIDRSKKSLSFDSVELDRLKPIITEIGYNESGELESKTILNQKKEKISEVIFSYNPTKRIEKHFHHTNASYDSIEIEYERPNFISHITQYLIDKNGTQKTSELTASNYFNQHGSIIKRTIFKLIQTSPIKTKEEYYEYNKSGLLIEKIEKSFYKGKESTKKLMFKYNYW